MSRRSVAALLPSLLLAHPLAARAQDSIYFGISPLLADYQTQEISPYSGLQYSLDEKQDGFKIFAGARAGKYFGVELAYDNFGQYRSSQPTFAQAKATTSVRGGSLFVVGFLPVYSVDLFAKAGMVYRKRRTLIDETTYCPTVCAPPPPDNNTGVGFSRLSDQISKAAYGGGAELIVRGGLSLRAEYERFHFDGETNVMSIGFTYQFR